MSTKVVNLRKEKYDVYIGRPSAGKPLGFGNPFRIGPDGDRNVVCDKHEAWLRGVAFTDFMQAERQWILDHLHELKGKTLGCFCKPARCHGETYIALINEAKRAPTTWDKIEEETSGSSQGY